MTHRLKTAAAALPLLAVLAGCNNFLSGDKLSSNPNLPVSADRYLLLNGVQATQFASQTGAAARTYGIWTQQFSGTDRQYISVEEYDIIPDDFTGTFTSTYSSGGLIDIRKIQADADKVNDKVFRGVAEVWEALTIGTAATIWGDIPYREAANPAITKPKLDPQAQVYADVQKLLDSAIVHLNSGQGPGPGAYDLVYGASTSSPASIARWVAAARTLKARYYMNLAEVDPTNYARVIAQANLGIARESDDFRTYQSASPGEENIWYQFMFRERDTYIRANATLVDLLKARNDPRLTEFFAPNASGEVQGAIPDDGDTGASTLSLTRGAPSFRQPLITWAENVLLRAEAEYQTGATAAALNDLNAVRAEIGLAPVVATGTALLAAIVEEEYIALFQNIEVMSLYARTCYPNITPVAGAGVPRRLYYGSQEANANPNIPDVSVQSRFNPNDKAGGTLYPVGVCIGQPQGS